MGKRSHVPFDTFAMQVEVPVSQLVRDDDFAWSCGQCPLDRSGAALFPEDLLAQAEEVCGYIRSTLMRGGLGCEALGKLIVYYVESPAAARDSLLALIRQHFGDVPLIIPVAVPHFYYDGMMIEVDVFAHPEVTRLPTREDAAAGLAIEAVVAGGLTWAVVAIGDPTDTGLTAAQRSERLVALLADAGLKSENLLSDHWFAPARAAEDTGKLAPLLRRTGLLGLETAIVTLADAKTPDIRAALTFSDQEVQSEPSEEGHSTGVALQARKSGPFLWLAGTCANADGDLVEQTRTIMEAMQQALTENGTSFASVVKLTAHYVGGATAEELHGNMTTRHSFYSKPGPASTGLPVAALLHPDCLIAIGAFAVV